MNIYKAYNLESGHNKDYIISVEYHLIFYIQRRSSQLLYLSYQTINLHLTNIIFYYLDFLLWLSIHTICCKHRAYGLRQNETFCKFNVGLPSFYIWVSKGVNFRTATFRRKPSFCVSNFLYGFLHVICARTCARINVYYSIITF